MILEQFKFDTFGEFYIKRDNISIWFDGLVKEEKENYYHYVFSRPRIKGLEYDACEMIWDWLTYQINDHDFDKYNACYEMVQDIYSRVSNA